MPAASEVKPPDDAKKTAGEDKGEAGERPADPPPEVKPATHKKPRKPTRWDQFRDWWTSPL